MARASAAAGGRRRRRAVFYLLGGGGYRCLLHGTRCAAWNDRRTARCARRTVLHPLCARHAARDLGVRVAPVAFDDGTPGCGLFATRDFRPGDLICPYLGRPYPAGGAWACPRAAGVAPPPGTSSGYNLGLEADPRGGETDASCHRSYASMANHARAAPARNCAFAYVRGLAVPGVWTPAAAGVPDPARRRGVRAPPVTVHGLRTRRAATVPALLADLPPEVDPAAVGAAAGPAPNLWLQATARVGAGQELRADYGPDWRSVLAVRSRTAPTLCPVRGRHGRRRR